MCIDYDHYVLGIISRKLKLKKYSLRKKAPKKLRHPVLTVFFDNSNPRSKALSYGYLRLVVSRLRKSQSNSLFASL